MRFDYHPHNLHLACAMDAFYPLNLLVYDKNVETLSYDNLIEIILYDLWTLKESYIIVLSCCFLLDNASVFITVWLLQRQDRCLEPNPLALVFMCGQNVSGGCGQGACSVAPLATPVPVFSNIPVTSLCMEDRVDAWRLESSNRENI